MSPQLIEHFSIFEKPIKEKNKAEFPDSSTELKINYGGDESIESLVKSPDLFMKILLEDGKKEKNFEVTYKVKVVREGQEPKEPKEPE